MKQKVFRPHLDDVENLSYGKGAKKQRGTGSRSICHRLNQDERKLYDFAKQDGYLTVKANGYRKERKGSPLCNIFRQRCDALKELCVIVEKYPELDRVVIDFSTLRVRDDAPYVSAILDNVFHAKYPDLYSGVIQQMETASKERITALSSSVAVPIQWETVQTEPIWAVKERLITVDCARDVAKAIAMDVLKEGRNFDILTVAVEEEVGDNTTVEAWQEEAPDATDDDDNCIDWDDI